MNFRRGTITLVFGTREGYLIWASSKYGSTGLETIEQTKRDIGKKSAFQKILHGVAYRCGAFRSTLFNLYFGC